MSCAPVVFFMLAKAEDHWIMTPELRSLTPMPHLIMMQSRPL